MLSILFMNIRKHFPKTHLDCTQGAIKKTTPEQAKGQRVKTSRTTSQAALSESDERKDKRREPQIFDLRATGDRRTKPSTTSRSVLPDKLKQPRQNGLPSKSSVQEPSRQVLARTRSEAVVKASAGEKAKSSVRKSTKEKIQPRYDEKRGVSTVYVPQDAASKLSSLAKSLNSEARRSREKSAASRAVEKTVPLKSARSRQSSRERKGSRTLSPSEVRILHSALNKGRSKVTKEPREQGRVEEIKRQDEKRHHDEEFEVFRAL